MSPSPNFIDCEQGSQMWAELRCGLVTASRCSDVLATIKKGESASRRNYRAELIVEILTGLPVEQYVSREMEWGSEQEPFARAAYELQQETMVETCGFVLHPSIPRFGASPDGLVGTDGMIQVKCPNTATHLTWMLAGAVPVEYAPQMLAEMACAGRQWSDFVSFDPRLPKHLQLFVRRFNRDDKLIGQLEAAVVTFTAEIDDTLARLPQPAEAQPVVAILDQMTDPDYDAQPVPEPEPQPRLKAKSTTAPKPTWDDLAKGGKRKWANYAAYEAAKDDWLQKDILRQFEEIIHRAKLQ
jgi:putative phage-type endonuclease